MKFYTVESYEKLCQDASAIIAEQIKSKPNTVLGLATGSTPIGTYKKLAEMNKAGELDFSKVVTINLDEYAGIDASNDQSYRYFMNKNLFDNINIDKNNTFVPNGKAEDLNKECEAYDERIKAYGGIDLQLLGIGHDGHIGFNEPDSVFETKTHVVKLTDMTIKANARFFENEDEVPKSALTMGMFGIFNAKKILMIVNGKEKKEILEKAFFGPITPEVPASILQLHGDVTVIYTEDK